MKLIRKIRDTIRAEILDWILYTAFAVITLIIVIAELGVAWHFIHKYW